MKLKKKKKKRGKEKRKGNPDKTVILNKINSFRKDILTLPNFLTSIRILFVPFVLWFVYVDTTIFRLLAFIIYTIASVTDYFDGYIARKQHSVSVTGKLLDPLADKFIVLLTLVLFLYMREISLLPVLLILARELYIFGVRNIAVESGLVIAAGASGKIKTVFQMFAIPFFILKDDVFFELMGWQWPNVTIGTILLWISLYFSYYSAYKYTFGLKKRLFDGE